MPLSCLRRKARRFCDELPIIGDGISSRAGFMQWVEVQGDL